MPKLVPIITDWTEEERIALVRQLHPQSEVRRALDLDISFGRRSDQERWYYTVKPTEDPMYNNDGSRKTNTHMFRLTVAHCQENLRRSV